MAQQRVINATAPLPADQQSYRALDEAKLADHLERFFLAEDNRERTFVFSAPLGGVHVYCYAPSASLKRDFWTIVTMGMSGTKMRVPEDVEDAQYFERAELMAYLPANWEFPKTLVATTPERHYTDRNWPVQLLRDIAQYVNVYGAWLAEDHGLPNFLSDPPGQPFTPNTKLSHSILLQPALEDEDMHFAEIDGKIVHFYAVVPLTAAEAQWKRERGAARSIYYIVGDKAQGGENVLVDYVIDPQRPCAVTDLRCREIYDNIEDEEEEEGEDDAN